MMVNEYKMFEYIDPLSEDNYKYHKNALLLKHKIEHLKVDRYSRVEKDTTVVALRALLATRNDEEECKVENQATHVC